MVKESLSSVSQSQLWCHAVLTQCGRVHRPDRRFSDRQAADAALLVLALRNARRAVELARQVCAPELQPFFEELLDEHDQALPGFRQARNALEHFDDYALGRGREQTRQTQEGESERVTYELGIAEIIDDVQIVIGPWTFSVNTISAVTTELAARLSWADLHLKGEVDIN